MSSSLEALAAVAAPALLTAVGLVPARRADEYVGVVRRVVQAASVSALVVAAWCAFRVLMPELLNADIARGDLPGLEPFSAGSAVAFDWIGFRMSTLPGVSFGVLIDGLSATLFLLVSFIGCLIVRYSARYLDGEATQGRFLRNLALTLGAVMFLVVSRNLLMFTAAWILSSTGLHSLLTHYGERTRAVAAARKKFVISRFGDLLLIVALILTAAHFGSLEFTDIMTAARRLGTEGVSDPFVAIISCLFVLGAMTKSAQFPFHSWLPETLEVPTPVSALMHAGLINAGGILVLRMSPLIAQSHLALDCLTVIGTLTALIGSIAMMTQTTVKRTLAYSTVAQMGFMMLECGLGAFSAALLHILGHSLYKAHAFLSSGSVLDSAAAMRVALPAPTSPVRQSLALIGAAGYSLSVGWIVATAMHSEFAAQSGSILPAAVLTMAVSQLLWKALVSGRVRVVATASLLVPIVFAIHFASYHAVTAAVTGVVALNVPRPFVIEQGLIGLILAGFAGLMLLHFLLAIGSNGRALRSLYVHAASGFYFDIFAHRVTAGISRALFGTDRRPSKAEQSVQSVA